MGRLPASWLQELLDRTNLRELVGSYVQLQKKGQRLWGKCPFHHDADPSFTVAEDRGFYHCFGCGKHGNALDFVMEMEHLDFREACAYLAQRTGMEMPQDDTPEERRSRAQKARILELNRAAAAFYHRILLSPAGKRGAEYFSSRGIDDALRTRYGLGYAPDSWHTLRKHLKEKGFTDTEAQASGLILCKNGNCYDAFRDRVIFPIINPFSEVIGFGGRILGDGQPKYLNSPATPAFNKSRSLFNLNTVKQLKNRGELKRLILMEGYMDVIGAARFGIFETCATLGTALTSEQCSILRRYSDRILVCYDGDGAGVKAANRAIDMLRDAGLKVRVVRLPGGMDPDEFLKKEGRAAFDQHAEQALAPLEFRFAVAAEGLDLARGDEKAEYVKKCVEILRTEKNPVDQQEYADRLAQQTNYPPYAIQKLLQDRGMEDRRPEAVQADSASRKARPVDPAARAENFIAALLVSRPQAAEDLAAILDAEDFLNPVNRSIFIYIVGTLKRDTIAGTAEVVASFDAPNERKHVQALLTAFGRYDTDKKSCDDMLFQSTRRLLQRRKMLELEKARLVLRTLSAPEEKEKQRAHVAALTEELETLKKLRFASSES